MMVVHFVIAAGCLSVALFFLLGRLRAPHILPWWCAGPLAGVFTVGAAVRGLRGAGVVDGWGGANVEWLTAGAVCIAAMALWSVWNRLIHAPRPRELRELRAEVLRLDDRVRLAERELRARHGHD